MVEEEEKITHLLLHLPNFEFVDGHGFVIHILGFNLLGSDCLDLSHKCFARFRNCLCG